MIEEIININNISNTEPVNTSGVVWYDWIMPALTFLAILVALFRNWFWDFVKKPKILMEFCKENERCYRIADEIVQMQGPSGPYFQDVGCKRQYYRIRVRNTGGNAFGLKAKVEVFDSNGKLAARSEPSLLRWITGESLIDLAKGEDSYVNLVSQVIKSSVDTNAKLRMELFDMTPRGIAINRNLAEWIFRVTIYGNNITNPLTKWYKYTPPKHEEQPGDLIEVPVP